MGARSEVKDMAAQGQTITSTQPQHRRMIEIFVVAFAGAALAITLAWAALGATSPKVVTLSRTTDQTLLEPGLVDQRAGERGGVVAPQILEPGLVDHRAGERGGVVAPAPSTGYPGGWTSTYSPIDVAPGGIDRNDHARQQVGRGELER
jgi:hypothetical protein